MLKQAWNAAAAVGGRQDNVAGKERRRSWERVGVTGEEGIRKRRQQRGRWRQLLKPMLTKRQINFRAKIESRLPVPRCARSVLSPSSGGVQTFDHAIASESNPLLTPALFTSFLAAGRGTERLIRSLYPRPFSSHPRDVTVKWAAAAAAASLLPSRRCSLRNSVPSHFVSFVYCFITLPKAIKTNSKLTKSPFHWVPYKHTSYAYNSVLFVM